MLYYHNKHIGSLSDSMLFQLYCGFILPISDYCDTVWAPPTALLLKSMEWSWILASFVSHMSNDNGFVKVTLTEFCHFHTIVQNYTSSCMPQAIIINNEPSPYSSEGHIQSVSAKLNQ